ncbi:MAG: quinolinate synthase NadA, partial [Candidatus Hydrothermarchaeales archaeon]
LLAKEQHPNAEVLIHPECKPEVQLLADHILSTGQMIRQIKESNSSEFIIGTEEGIIHRMKKEAPAKVFIPALEDSICVNMKMHTMEKVLKELKERKNVVTVDPTIAERATASLERMLELS